ncbi:hypothetical protein KIW84_034348 [Lathyrus oleraceus]|uniref:Uncharacterized protein n=1 Tax=Pisum sativum TaxID=3888 RepID=A0A9D4XYB6_PEA|nr:hypothetical protein KIW84_034348 [Pisum sativum]
MDSDLAESLDDREYTLGYMVAFVGGAVAWKSKWQKCVSLSSTEVEFIAVVETSVVMVEEICNGTWCETRKVHSKLMKLEKIHTVDNGSNMFKKCFLGEV